MNWYHWLSIIACGICFSALFVHVKKLINAGSPKDFSKPAGPTSQAIKYSMTAAMSPRKKESAFLYLPTYTAGMLYHLGTFLSLFLFIILLLGFHPDGMISYLIISFLLVTGVCGLAILIKRVLKQELRELSNPDDYISNLIVTVFQFITVFLIMNPKAEVWYFLLISLLLLYIPFGKLKHTIYFFAARYHLGFFYGWRGVWPPKEK